MGIFPAGENVVPSAVARDVTADNRIEVVVEDLIVSLQPAAQIVRGIAALERHPARRDDVNGSQNRLLRRVDEDIAFAMVLPLII